MKVNIRQFEFDTDEMTAFETGNAKMPLIFVNTSGAAFVQLVRNCWETPRVRHIPRYEGLRLADCYGLVDLKTRLLRVGQGADAVLAEQKGENLAPI